MTIPQSPAPAPLAASEANSPASAREQRSMRRQLRILSLVLLVPGLIVFVVGSLAAVSDVTHPDPFAYVSPLARVGWGLLALGTLLLLPLARMLRRLNPRLSAQARAFVLQRYRHPRLAVVAAIWWYLVLAATFAALALAPHELLSSWLTPVDAPKDVLWYSTAYGAAVFLAAFLTGVIIAIVPTVALRLFDRPR
jgi:FtsH-binding integral membrane protein